MTLIFENWSYMMFKVDIAYLYAQYGRVNGNLVNVAVNCLFHYKLEDIYAEAALIVDASKRDDEIKAKMLSIINVKLHICEKIGLGEMNADAVHSILNR